MRSSRRILPPRPLVALVMAASPVAWLALSSLASCSSTATEADGAAASVASTSGVDAGDPEVRRRARFLTDLTLDERKQLCDWTAALGGGYGKVTACEGGLAVSNPRDQAACLDGYLNGCDTATVTDWEGCRRKEVSDPCALFLYSAEECRELRRCLGRTDGGPPPSSKDGG